MGWQESVALGIVVATAAAFVWSKFRRRRLDFHRQTHCGCSPAGARESIVFHARKGERPTLTVKAR